MRHILLLLAASGIPLVHAQSWSQPVREVEKPHRAPYQYSVGVNFGFNCQNCDTQQFPALPANKRLVVEHVAVTIQTPATGEYSCRIGPAGGPFMPLESARRFNGFATISQPARLYLDSAPLLSCSRNESSAIQWGGIAFVSGYLVDKP